MSRLWINDNAFQFRLKSFSQNQEQEIKNMLVIVKQRGGQTLLLEIKYVEPTKIRTNTHHTTPHTLNEEKEKKK